MKIKDNNSYNKSLKEYAKANRKNATKSEACLWKFVLSRKQMMGFTFKRQRPIGNFIVDFVCLPLGLIVEVDGITHEDEKQQKKDNDRDKALEKLDFTTLRFSSWEVLNRIVEVELELVRWIEDYKKNPPPRPLQRGKTSL